MAQQGLAVFDHTVQETNAWLSEIAEEMGQRDRQMAYHALRGVLFTVRDRLTVDEALDLSAQLPMLLRGLYFEGYKPADKPLKIRDRDVFLERVNKELQAGGYADPAAATAAVFKVMEERLTDGLNNHVRDMLPEEISSMWPEAAAQS